jgi:hypothetical protein
MLRTVALDPVHSSTTCLAWFDASAVVVSVTSASDDKIVVPAIAESNSAVMLVFTNAPQFVVPSAGSDSPRSGVDAI